MARPTVHRTGSRRLLADKTGFDPRHRVSSVIFRVVPRPLWSSRPAGVRASRSLAKDHFIYDTLGDSSNPERAEEANQQGSDEGPSEVVDVQEPEISQVTDAPKPGEVEPVTVPGTEHPVVESVLEAVSLEETTGSDTGEKAGSGSQGTSQERSSGGEQ